MDRRGKGPSHRRPNRYTQLLEHLFEAHYSPGTTEVTFDRAEMEAAAEQLGIKLPRNPYDVLYSFRFRAPIPEAMQQKAPPGREWIIRTAGRGAYKCVASSVAANIVPDAALVETKVPDSTPGVIALYALDDEQALLARLRYNRLIDIFTGVTCYSLQNHLRTTVKGRQMETDEVYVGMDRRAVHYVFPVQAKGGRDKLNVVQIEQDLAMCALKFPHLVCRPIAAQFMADQLIALFELQETETGVAKAMERHYRLVPPDQLTAEDLSRYSRLPE
jgi:hypothetical protein